MAVIWLLLALFLPARPSHWLFSGFQAAAATALWFAVMIPLSTRDWFMQARQPLFDPWLLTAEGIAIAFSTVLWSMLRMALTRWPRQPQPIDPVVIASEGNVEVNVAANSAGNVAGNVVEPSRRRTSDSLGQRLGELLRPAWWTIDEILLRVSLVAFVALAVYAAVPGAARELSPRSLSASGGVWTRIVPPLANFEYASIPHDHAQGTGMWLWMAMLGGRWRPKSALGATAGTWLR